MENKNLGAALSRIHSTVEQREGIHVVHTSEVNRRDREILEKEGWLQEIIKGWYALVRLDIRPGDSSGWYANFWDFLYVYLTHFYGDDYCLSAEHSLDLHLGETVVPKQVVVMAPKGRGSPINLPFDTSLLVYNSGDLLPKEREEIRRLQVMSLPYALCKVAPSFFHHQPQQAEIALQSIKSSDDLLRVIVQNNFVRAAGRLVGGYRFLKNDKMANALVKGLDSASISITETNPFEHTEPLLSGSGQLSPYAARIHAMWHKFRPEVVKLFPEVPGMNPDYNVYLHQVDESYLQDAYHSLSIEGYKVSPELIEKVLNANWDPKNIAEDLEARNALAARGYYEAFLEVKASLTKIFNGGLPGEVFQQDLSSWYQKLFAPCVAARIIKPEDLFGYRRHQVYIRNSRHTPLPVNALPDAMEALFQCLKEEEHAGVRAVLGHFIFVFIHPYMDGNGRIGRFLMNAMLGSGGYPWTIVHVERRGEYLRALEEASCDGNIVPFVQFIKSELKKS